MSDIKLEPESLSMDKVYLEALKELKNPFPSVLLPDWRWFNSVTGGFRGREFTILCGSTGSGKTTWLANLSAQLLKNAVKHFVMSVETGHTDFMKRIMSVLSGKDLNTGDLVKTETLREVDDEHGRLFSGGMIEFSIYDNRVKLGQLLNDLEYMATIKGCKVAMIDNLNFFLDVTTAANAVVEVDRVIHELIMLCKRIDMHIIMVMHPKKTDHGRVESEFDIKGSSTAVQEAHNVLLFNRLPQSQIMVDGDRYVRELKIAKMRRRGKFVGKSIIFESQETRYVERGLQ